MHVHDHAHGAQDHVHVHERFADHPHNQHVVLDIGDGVGALIVHTDPGLLGNEVEISPAGDDTSRSHKEVLERVIGGRSSYVLVFDNLSEGDHTLWIDDVARARNVRVTSGEIAELDWRSARQGEV
jgi:hypothetical protein